MTKFNTKNIFILAGFLFISTLGMAQTQSLTIDASQMFTNFKFVNSDGTQDKDYISNVSGAYSLGYQYSFDFGLMINPRIGMRKAGATMMYDNSNYIWDLQYADFKLGLGYKYELGRFSPYFKASPYVAYLMTANQVLNNENYDLLENEELKPLDFGVFFQPGVHASLSDYISAYAEFNYMMGLNNIETNANGQEGFNKAMAVTLGLSFTITGSGE